MKTGALLIRALKSLINLGSWECGLAENPLGTQRSSDSGAARSRLEQVMTAPSQRCEEEQGPRGAALMVWRVSDMCERGWVPPSPDCPPPEGEGESCGKGRQGDVGLAEMGPKQVNSHGFETSAGRV